MKKKIILSLLLVIIIALNYGFSSVFANDDVTNDVTNSNTNSSSSSTNSNTDNSTSTDTVPPPSEDNKPEDNPDVVIEKYIMLGNTPIVNQGEVQDFSIVGVSYNETNNTLTLNNYTGTESIYIQNINVNIEIIGTNTITNNADMIVIQSNNNIDTTITLTGKGTLNMISEKEDIPVLASYGGDGDTTFVMNGPTINMIGYNTVINSIELLSIKSGTITAKCTDNSSVPLNNTVKYSSNMQYIDNGNTIIIKEIESIQNNDAETGIKLESTTKELPEDTKIIAEKIDNGKVYDTVEKALKETTSKFVVYDITLNSNNATIQPNGKVKISIPIPDNLDTSKLVIYRIAENGEKTEYKVTVETIENIKYATFETDHFSTYVLAETSNINSPNNPQGKEDDTIASGELPQAGVGIGLTISLITCIGIFVFVYKKCRYYKDI